MQIKILGTRGNIKTDARLHTRYSGMLIDNKVMLDIGEKEYLKYKPEIVFITHLHPDHAFFIIDRKTKLDMPVYAPENFAGINKVEIIKRPLRFNEYLITPIPVIHSLKVKSIGYLVEKGGKRIFYTGDVAGFKGALLKKLGRLDIVITEASFFRKGGFVRHRDGQAFGHTGVPDLVSMFKEHTNRIVFTHFGSWFINNIDESTKKIKGLETASLKLEAAYDGGAYVV
ncbi:MAG: MBL fold metallo-hydrolase [Chitinophagales bacterium]